MKLEDRIHPAINFAINDHYAGMPLHEVHRFVTDSFLMMGKLGNTDCCIAVGLMQEDEQQQAFDAGTPPNELAQRVLNRLRANHPSEDDRATVRARILRIMAPSVSAAAKPKHRKQWVCDACGEKRGALHQCSGHNPAATGSKGGVK